MRIAKFILAAAATLGIAAAAQATDTGRGEQELAKALEGRVAGKPVSCISLTSIQSSRIIDRTAILYRSGGKLYVNRPRSGGNFLRDDDVLVSYPFGSQLCRMDMVKTVSPPSLMQTGFIGLGDFVPYTKPTQD